MLIAIKKTISIISDKGEFRENDKIGVVMKRSENAVYEGIITNINDDDNTILLRRTDIADFPDEEFNVIIKLNEIKDIIPDVA